MVLTISPTATCQEFRDYPATSDGGTRLMWRTAPSDVIQGQAIANVLLGTSDYDAGFATRQNVGILYLSDAYGQGLNSSILTDLTATRPSPCRRASPTGAACRPPGR